MKIALGVLGLFALLALFLIWRSRRESIGGMKNRNRHFAWLAKQLQLKQSGDDYFTQLEGTWKGTPVLIYPHNFQGPGSITLFYADTGVPFRERTWIEPTLSLGRAIVEWKRKNPFQHEIVGEPVLPHETIMTTIEQLKAKYPYIAITTPTRFIFSHYVMQAIGTWSHFVVLLVLDAGRKPSLREIQQALDASVHLAEIVRQ